MHNEPLMTNWHRWEELTTTDFATLDKQRTIVVMPVGSVEQHGPHLPLSVDVRITEGVLTETLRRLPDSCTVLVLPMLPVGKANEHIAFDGTLSLSVQTLISLWTDVAESVFRTGLKKLMILNGHGGQSQVSEIVARDLRVRHNALVVPVNWWSARPAVPSVFGSDEEAYGYHGGAEETSVMLHLHPDLVRRKKIANFTPRALAQKERFPLLYGNGVRHAWAAGDLNPTGAIGDASRATAEEGRRIVEEASPPLAALIAEMADFTL